MRHRVTKIALRISAVDSVADLCEENRIRHWRVVPLVAGVVDLHAERLEVAARRVVAACPGRHRPIIKPRSVDRNGHALSGFIYLYQQVGMDGLAERNKCEGAGDQRGDKTDKMHQWPLRLRPHSI